MGLSLVAIGKKVVLTCVSGVCVFCGTERALPGSPGVRVRMTSLGELPAVGLLKNPPDAAVPSVDLLNGPPCVPGAGARFLPNKLLGEVRVESPLCSPKIPPPVVGCGGVNTVPRLGAVSSPGLPSREGTVPGIDGTLRRGVFAGSDVSFVDGVPKENGCIFDKSGFLLCDSTVLH